MSWPLSHDFNEAIQTPKLAFADADLKTAEPVVGATGLPLPRSGNFADVYQLRGADGKDWAVKCFTRPVVGLAERYARVSEALKRADLPFTVSFAFLSDGIRVGGAMRPVVKMEWVEGLLLNQVVRENAGRPNVLAALGQMWVRLCKRLREAGIAHADLQHGNVLLVPGSRPGAYGLKLIDYDGMYVPALTNQPSGEVGHPSYQHPTRAATRAYSPDVDRFPHLVIATALKGLEVGGPALWDRYDTGDNLLFTEDDFQKPAESKLMKELWRTERPAVQSFVGRLALACGKPIPQTPWLDQLAPEGEPTALDNPTRQAAAAALGIALPVPVALPPEPGPAPPVALLPLPDEPLPLTPPPATALPLPKTGDNADFDFAPRRRTAASASMRTKSRPSQSSKGPLLIAGVVLLLVAGAVAAIALSSGGKPKDNPPDDSKPVVPKPKDDDPQPKPKPRDDDPKPKPKDNDGKPPVKSQEKELDPLVIKPVGRLQATEKWKHELGVDGSIPQLTSSSDSQVVVVRSGAKLGSVVLNLETGKPPPGMTKLSLSSRPLFPLDDGRFALSQFFSNVPTPLVDLKAGRLTSAGSLKPVALPEQTTGNSYVSPNARYLAFGAVGRDQQPAPFRLKEAASDKTILEFDWVGGHVHFTADSSRVLVAEGSGKCRWFKLPSGEPDGEWTLDCEKSAANTGVLAASADGQVLLFVGRLKDHAQGQVHLLDGRNGRVLRSLAVQATFPPASLSRDGRLLALPTRDPKSRSASVNLIETASGNVVGQLPAFPDTLFMIPHLLPDGSGLVAIVFPGPSATQSIIRYDMAPASATPMVPAPAPAPSSPAVPELKNRWTATALKGVARFHVEPALNLLLVASTPSSGYAAFDYKTGKPRSFPDALAFGLTGFFPLDKGQLGTLAKQGDDILLWDLKSGKQLARKIDIPDVPTKMSSAPAVQVSLARNGKYLAVGRSIERRGAVPDTPLRVIDTSTRAGKALLSTDWKGGSVHFTADSSRVLVVEFTGRCRWFKLPAGTPDGEWDLGEPPGSLRHTIHEISADGSALAYTGPAARRGRENQAPAVLDGKTGKPVHIFQDGLTFDVSISADGRRAAVMMNGREQIAGTTLFGVVDVTSGKTLGQVRVSTGIVVPPFALAPDGQALLVLDRSGGKLHVFDVPDRK